MTTSGGFDARTASKAMNGLTLTKEQIQQALMSATRSKVAPTKTRVSSRRPMVVETGAFKAILSSPDPDIVAAVQGNPGILSAVDSYGYTLLWYAAIGQPNLKHVEALLQAGAMVDQPIEAGSTVFMSAVFNGQLDIAEALRKAGANINHSNKNGHCALTMAVRSGKPEPVTYLLNLKGIDLAPKDRFGKYPIQYFNIDSINTHRNLLARALFNASKREDTAKDALDRYIRAVGLSYLQHTDQKLYNIATKKLGFVLSEMKNKE